LSSQSVAQLKKRPSPTLNLPLLLYLRRQNELLFRKEKLYYFILHTDIKEPLGCKTRNSERGTRSLKTPDPLS